MQTGNKSIITGVDKLVELVHTKEKITLAIAAEIIGVHERVIQDWVNLFDDKGPIAIEYQFAKPYLVPRKLTPYDLQSHSNEFSAKKEVILRKAEVNLNSFRNHLKELRTLKPEFVRMKNEIGLELTHIKKDLWDMETYYKMRDELQKQIDQQQLDPNSKLKAISSQIASEKAQYNEFLQLIKQERIAVRNDNDEIKNSQKEIHLLNNKLKDIKLLLNLAEQQVSTHNAITKNSELRVQDIYIKLEELTQNFKKHKTAEIKSLERIKQEEAKLLGLRNTIIQRINKNQENVKKSETKSKTIRKDYDRKLLAIDLYQQITKDGEELETNLFYLIRKTKLFNLSLRHAHADQELRGLEDKLNELNKMRGVFEFKINKLISFFKG